MGKGEPGRRQKYDDACSNGSQCQQNTMCPSLEDLFVECSDSCERSQRSSSVDKQISDLGISGTWNLCKLAYKRDYGTYGGRHHVTVPFWLTRTGHDEEESCQSEESRSVQGVSKRLN